MVSLEPDHECKYSFSEACGSSEFIFSSFCRWESQGAEDHLNFYSQEVHGSGSLRLGLRPMGLAKKSP